MILYHNSNKVKQILKGINGLMIGPIMQVRYLMMTFIHCWKHRGHNWLGCPFISQLRYLHEHLSATKTSTYHSPTNVLEQNWIKIN